MQVKLWLFCSKPHSGPSFDSKEKTETLSPLQGPAPHHHFELLCSFSPPAHVILATLASSSCSLNALLAPQGYTYCLESSSPLSFNPSGIYANIFPIRLSLVILPMVDGKIWTYCFAVSFKRWNLFPLSLNLSWPCH